jgi:rare lipoprotein A
VLCQDIFAGEPGGPPVPFDAIVRGCLEPDLRQRLSLPDIRKLLKPKPILVPEFQPVPKPRVNEPLPSYSRGLTAPIGRIAIAAAVVILGLLAFAFLRHGHNVAPRPAGPRVSHPPAAAVQAPVTATATPVVTPPPAPAPAKPTPAAPAQHIGRADYFSDDLEGHPTASGEKFSNQGMTAAHREFPIGTHLRVTNLQNGRHVIVRVNDRGPHRRGFIISVTRHAAEQLGFVKAGSTRVKLEVVK